MIILKQLPWQSYYTRDTFSTTQRFGGRRSHPFEVRRRPTILHRRRQSGEATLNLRRDFWALRVCVCIRSLFESFFHHINKPIHLKTFYMLFIVILYKRRQIICLMLIIVWPSVPVAFLLWSLTSASSCTNTTGLPQFAQRCSHGLA